MNIVQITAYLSIINQQRIFPHFLQLFAIFFFFINFFIFEVSRHFFFIAMIPSALNSVVKGKKIASFMGRSDILILSVLSDVNFDGFVRWMSNRWKGN